MELALCSINLIPIRTASNRRGLDVFRTVGQLLRARFVCINSVLSGDASINLLAFQNAGEIFDLPFIEP